MPFRYRPKSLGALESVLGQPALIVGQVFNRQPEVVGVLHEGEQLFRFLQAHLPLSRRPLAPLDPLIHGVHDRPCEVGFRIRQLRLVVRASSLAQSQESLAL
jgi:hypothetical protein